MPLRTPRSLHLRLWGVIGMACLPVFLMAFFDYRERRQDAIVALENEVSRMLTAARLTEDAALGSMRQTFQIMARADNLQSLDPQDCSGLAQRLLQSMEDFANLGAALPDGTVFCSASPGQTRVSVTDRNWFQEAQSGEGITSGEFVTGRISGKPSMVFGYPVRDADGTLKAVLFASIQLGWFDKLIAEFKLPQGWNAFLLSDTGTVLSYHPAASRPPQTAQAPAGAAPFLRALQEGRRISEIEGLDGNRRMYGVGSPRFSRTPLLVAIGAPLDRTVARIDQGFWWRILLLAGIALVSVLTARFYIYGLIEAWTGQITAAIDSVAAGRLQTRIRRLSHVSELRAVEQGINHMASELEKREVDLRRLSTAVEQSPEAIIITDTEARIQYVNDAFLRSTGYTREEVLGQNPRILNRGLTPPATYATMWGALKAGKVWSGELINTRKDGSTYVEMATIAPIFDEDGQVTHYVSTKEDITQRKQSEALVHQLAYYDALTGLPNRALLHEHLQQAVEASAQGTAQGLLLLIDIDRFKQINDTRGHATGDWLLREMARRIQGCTGAADTVARLGSNTFGIIVPDIGGPSDLAQAIARNVHQTLAAPYDLGDAKRLYATTSMGIAYFCAGMPAPDILLKQAEVALYRAKDEGGNAVLFFDAPMQAAVDARAALEMALRDAIEIQAFRMFYQVQVDQHGTVVGAEALIRWIGADGKVVSPAEFIPLAEDTGLIVPMGQWVLDTACRQLARWQRSPATRHLTLAINVSARQFHQADFAAQLRSALERHHLDASGLKLELTESAILGDIDTTIERMHQLRELGIRFALDDFGTGYSSLSYLKRLPFDQLKIDQSFIHDMLTDNTSNAIVRAILVMSDALGLEIVAEGVETADHRAFLVQHGCQFCQGYLLGRPMPIEAWEEAHLAVGPAPGDTPTP
ncbi:EAL domain-containing protein [Acidovorax sp. 210-6]|uniref:bifunctional diguanylate cyclase/phosphodiesterase n=1 Tax=Acidovorax sp. 210-6 TaxID=2699468 RepID=UPI00138A231F|nr:EAL domain-containing protein [Acidovorax sp. 210-6]NCU64552.1 EAL domain-containing protein [Acidovorax sp. 210-6]